MLVCSLRSESTSSRQKYLCGTSYPVQRAMSDFAAVLSALMSTDNQTRRGAEEYFEAQLQSNLDPCLNALMETFAVDGNPVLRSFSAVLLRRALEKHAVRISPEATHSMRARLMSVWAQETNAMMLHRLAHVMAQSCLKCPWDELIPSIIHYASSAQDRPKMMVPVLGLVEILSDYCPEDILKHLPLLTPFLGQFMVGDAQVQIACAKAAGACIVSLEGEEAVDAFKPALQPMLAVLGVALSTGEEIDATKIVEYLVTVAQERPGFFKGSLEAVAGAMLQVGNAQGLEFSTRSMALELLVTITETAPALARRCPGLVQGLVPLAMSLMLEVEEEDGEWAAGVYSEEPADENSSVGDEAVERMAAGLGGKSVSELVLAMVTQYSADPDYKKRRAAVAALCRLAEGSTKHFTRYLPQALAFLTQALQDSSPRVRFEGIQTIGRFAVLYPELSAQLIGGFLPLLTQAMQGQGACDRVRGHAATALIDLLNPDSCDLETLSPVLEPLLQALLGCLQNAPLEVRSPCLVLLGCVAQVCGPAFAPYYASFMPGIKSVLREATAPDLSTLRGKAMECVGLLGEAVGVAVFGADAQEIMTLFMQALQLDTERDTTFDYILPACARISKALTGQFEPFLPQVMELLLQGARQDVQFSMTDADEDAVLGDVVQDEDTGTESAVVSLGAGVKKLVSLNTHAVQQKNQAARVLYEFADALRGNLRGYILPSLQVLLDLVTYKHSSDIRSSAALACAKMFEAFSHAVQMGFLADDPTHNVSLQAVLDGCVGKLLEALRDETDITARACGAEAVRDVLQACYTSGAESVMGSRGGFKLVPGMPLCEGVVRQLLQRCAESLLRREHRLQSIGRNDGLDAEDREAAGAELEEEEDLLTTYADSFGQMLKLHGEAFMPEFDHFIAPAFSPYLAATQPPALQVVAVYLVDDVVEFGGQGMHRYLPQLLPVFLRNCTSEHAQLRQASVYGIAKAVYAAPQLLAPHLGQVLPCLMQIVSAAAAEEEEDEEEEGDGEGTLENAVFALGTIICEPLYRSALTALGDGIQQITAVWLSRLPLSTDPLQARLSARQLCEGIDQGQLEVTQVLRIVAQILHDQTPDTEESMTHPETLARLKAQVRTLISSPAAQGAFEALSPELQQALRAAV
ncbi:armadillo-type protein [Ochromonadaceae sp. CCMP2298]|nr:armadillo-type protein [Ochromonadaceae sp. CCMP2298]